jgi:hypothetical protein
MKGKTTGQSSEKGVDKWRGYFGCNDHHPEEKQPNDTQTHPWCPIDNPESYQVNQHSGNPFQNEHK